MAKLNVLPVATGVGLFADTRGVECAPRRRYPGAIKELRPQMHRCSTTRGHRRQPDGPDWGTNGTVTCSALAETREASVNNRYNNAIELLRRATTAVWL